MPDQSRDPLFGAARLKLSFVLKGLADSPGFRVVYFGTIKELGLTNTQVDTYINEHRADLEKHIADHKNKD
jgi:hypothetical protein